MPDDLNRCPTCNATRDHADAPCSACGYDPHPAPDNDAALDAWEAKIERDAASYPRPELEDAPDGAPFEDVEGEERCLAGPNVCDLCDGQQCRTAAGYRFLKGLAEAHPAHRAPPVAE